MLSVTLYGRNDNHGYNLHKRGAISINAIAELLNDPDDEILFVDYNTPDDLPTFPEAIADTLTRKAWERLKILRVRASQHHRFKKSTHLNALEPIARNVAIRRSNPANRWVLSTNTDMIFVPHRRGASLSEVLGDLDDGFYHLPRFELPEALWETLDRTDGEGIIEKVRTWGTDFHLNEIVRSGGDNVFDGPGDFQLFLRSDLFEIGGFHEEMILGWHVDANIARRMRLLRGSVSSAMDRLWGYHCDHTRQATPYHTIDRLENSASLYVDNVQSAALEAQRSTFGLAEEDVEVVRLGETSGIRYLTALRETIAPPMQAATTSYYLAESYGALDYDLDHVLPFLLDLVSCVSLSSRIGYLGARKDTFTRLSEGWKALGGQTPVLVPVSADWLANGDGEGVRALDLVDWAEQADLFVFEVGAANGRTQMELDAEDRARLWMVNVGFWTALESDVRRQRQGAEPRRVLAVNAIHNYFERQVAESVSAKLTPFSSRIRHGYFVDRAATRTAAASLPTRIASSQLGLPVPFGASDLKRLGLMVEGVAAQLDRAQGWSDCTVMAAELIALIDARHPVFGEAPPARLETLRSALSKARPSAAMGALAVGIATEPSRASSRLVQVEDWEDEGFLNTAARLFPGRDHTDLFQRDLWVWERIALSHNLWSNFTLGERPKVLFVLTGPDLGPIGLANLGAEVDICDCETLLDGRLGGEDWRGQYSEDSVTSPGIFLAQDRTEAIANGFRYDAVVIAQNAALIRGRETFGKILRSAALHLRPGGTLHLSARVVIGAEPPLSEFHALPVGLVYQGRLARLISEQTELQLDEIGRWHATARTLDRVSNRAGSLRAPPLVQGDYPYLETLAVFAFRKRAEEPTSGELEAGWRMVEEALAKGEIDPAVLQPLPADEGRLVSLLNGTAIARAEPPDFGSVIRRMRAPKAIARTPLSIRLPGLGEEEPALYGSLGGLPPGPYEIELETRSATAVSGRLIVVRANEIIGDFELGTAPGLVKHGGVFNVVDDGCDLGVAVGLVLGVECEVEVNDLILR